MTPTHFPQPDVDALMYPASLQAADDAAQIAALAEWSAAQAAQPRTARPRLHPGVAACFALGGPLAFTTWPWLLVAHPWWVDAGALLALVVLLACGVACVKAGQR